ncbi:MAG: GNAT family N-acetyltransferase, partial [Oscillospiraceae bacterium]|nr:GNAT family N-acetyltransferase [Oscillospiraceae bacterium]
LIEVFEEHQRKGTATLLVQEILKMEKAKGTYQVRAYCDIKNSESHALWIKNKFGISPVKMSDGTILGSFVTYVL